MYERELRSKELPSAGTGGYFSAAERGACAWHSARKTSLRKTKLTSFGYTAQRRDRERERKIESEIRQRGITEHWIGEGISTKRMGFPARLTRRIKCRSSQRQIFRLKNLPLI